jgi:ParB/RepB/Spo0J family partition protein
MAMKLNAGETGRQDLFSIFPENIVVIPGENGRKEPHSQEEIESLARSILEYTQLEPVVVRRIEDHKVQLVAGYGRYAAVKYINTALQPGNPVKLQCKVVDLNPEEAFVRNLVENIERAATTPIDDAHNQRRLREQYGWSEAKIADFYKKSVAFISQLRKTLVLPTEIQQGVAQGNIPLAALDLAELPAHEQQKAVAEATNPETGKVVAEAIRKRVRGKKIEAGGGKARSSKEVRTFFEELTGPAEAEAEAIRGLSQAMVLFLSGKITDKQMTNALEKFTKSAAA